MNTYSKRQRCTNHSWYAYLRNAHRFIDTDHGMHHSVQSCRTNYSPAWSRTSHNASEDNRKCRFIEVGLGKNQQSDIWQPSVQVINYEWFSFACASFILPWLKLRH